jgi:hypothetical protein
MKGLAPCNFFAVEDDEALRQIIVKRLKAEGYAADDFPMEQMVSIMPKACLTTELCWISCCPASAGNK